MLYGPLASGKTTLATTLAEKYDKENHLAGTFFFSGIQVMIQSVDPSTESSLPLHTVETLITHAPDNP